MSSIPSAYWENSSINNVFFLENVTRENKEIRSMAKNFNKIRELEILFLDYSEDFEKGIYSIDDMGNNKEFKEYVNENFHLSLDTLIDFKTNITEFLSTLINAEEQHKKRLEKHIDKLNDIENMIKVTSDIFLNEDNDSKDESFFTEYKTRLKNLLKKHRDDILTIRTQQNYHYNLYHLIRDINEKQYLKGKYICYVCNEREKDVYLDCGHTYCRECISMIKNKMCPYCQKESKNVHNLYLN